eukprot:TRINITY_DN32732_c0_g1_i1.p1 TRINITY_DN32732_c0_g1~~TRINITY_DN32732_c0_g1_i1.p1  ORF type:complete len:942 (-),score=124.05 TRINITY_DN32732_c0_g1_i1:243-3068(-)
MGSCCCGGGKAEKEQEADNKFKKGAENDLSNGPAGNRGCTDAWCLIVLIVAWLAYIIVTFMGVADGNPSKLYLPRDYAGQYCDVEKNWNDGLNLKGFKKLSYTMNATSTTDQIVKQLLCSSVADRELSAILIPGRAEVYSRYQCECCLSPCKKCQGSLEVGGDLSSGSDMSSTIGGKMSELKGENGGLYSPGAFNGDMFTNIWSDATKYFNKVCMPDCNTNFQTANNTDNPRTWTYSMSPDNPLKEFWDILKTEAPSGSSVKNTISQSFTFKVLPLSLCPYNESKCIPMPGVAFGEGYGGYCTFDMSTQVIEAVGSSAASAFEGLGGASFQDSATETFGKWVGDFERSILAFILVTISTFVIGFVYLVLLRLFIGVCVWFAIFLVLLLLVCGGGLCWVRSIQCANTGLLDTSKQVGVAATVTATVAVSNVASGNDPVSEELHGDGHAYTGVQFVTTSGLRCAKWGKPGTNAENYTAALYPDSRLAGDPYHSYCRNPYNASDLNKGSTIWCFTTDTTIKWQECRPVGVILPECKDGYAVNNEIVREVLKVCAYILWVLGGIYLILVCIFQDRIRLAIAVNKVAATFVAHTPRILLVPIVQAIIGVLWIGLWAFSASFLLSQVPASYTPTRSYASYAEAYGTTDIPGKCNDKWPAGTVWKNEDVCPPDAKGNPQCWNCAPPRYIFDTRFAVSFFVFLWNNALNVAMGQCIIAGAVGVWFFTPNAEKGKRRAIATSVYNVFRYHLGSLAFGSFIIAVIQFIRYCMKYLEKQAKQQKNKVMVMVFKAIQCCLWCFEKCMKFLNKNAYIQIALMGTNFCTSAKKAFFLILRNIVRFGTVALLGSMIHMIGFLFIVVSSVGLGYLFLTALHPDVGPAVCLVVYAFTAYLVAKLFMNIFGLAVDSTLQCFLACEEMELGGDFVPSSMSRWLDKNKPIGAAEEEDQDKD